MAASETPRGLGFSARCKVCTSNLRSQADEKLLAGVSARAVAKWLSDEGEPTSHVSVGNHKSEHLNVLSEARARLDDAQAQAAATAPQFEAAVEKVLAEIKTLDQVASAGMGVANALKAKIDKVLGDDGDGRLDPTQAQLFAACLREVREAVKAKYDILDGDKRLGPEDLANGLAGLLALGHAEGV